MPSSPFSFQWIYIQNCVSEVPPEGSGNKVHLNPWTIKKGNKINRDQLCPSPKLAERSPQSPVLFLSPTVLKALTKLASQPESVLSFSLLVLAATINNHWLHKAESASVLAFLLGYYVAGGWRVA